MRAIGFLMSSRQASVGESCSNGPLRLSRRHPRGSQNLDVGKLFGRLLQCLAFLLLFNLNGTDLR